MKFLKRFAMVIVMLILVWMVLALIAPKNVHVERSKVMQTDASVVFGQINTLKNWKTWSFWDQIDTKTMKDSWEGPESGVGAVHKWESPNDSVGTGSLTISKSEENKFVETQLHFEGKGEGVGGWKIADTTGGVKVTTYIDFGMPFIMRPMCFFMNMDKMLGPDFVRSLDNLDAKCANMPKTKTFNMSEKDLPDMMILSIRDTVKSMSEIGPKLGELYMEIGKVMKKAGADFTGPVFAIYHHYGDDMIDIEAGVPVNKEIKKTEGRVKYSVMKAGKVVMLDYYGAYEDMKIAYDAIHAWAEKNNRKLGDAPWEIYVGDPGIEKDPSKLLTQVVYYVE